MKLKVLVIVVLVVAGGVAVVASLGGLPGAGSANATQYLTATATTGNVTDEVAATGTIAAARTYAMGFGAPPQVTTDTSASVGSGTWTVTEVDAEVGKAVKAGDVLARASTDRPPGPAGDRRDVAPRGEAPGEGGEVGPQERLRHVRDPPGQGRPRQRGQRPAPGPEGGRRPRGPDPHERHQGARRRHDHGRQRRQGPRLDRDGVHARVGRLRGHRRRRRERHQLDVGRPAGDGVGRRDRRRDPGHGLRDRARRELEQRLRAASSRIRSP